MMGSVGTCIQSRGRFSEQYYKHTLSARTHKLIFIFLFAGNDAEVDGVTENVMLQVNSIT
jgi:hypothetical protein